MNSKKLVLPIVGALLALALWGSYVLLHTGLAKAAVSQVPAPAAPAVHEVSLFADHAEPTQLLINVGESVQFNSKDGNSHNIDSGAGNAYGETHDHAAEGIASGEFGPDEGYRVEFKKVGAYFFHDHDHPNITISVAVYDPAAPSGPAIKN